MSETWKVLVGFPRYRISTDGRVRHSSGRILKPYVDKRDGYAWVGLWDLERKKAVNLQVGRLVLETFVGPRPNGLECRHLNDVKTDNRLVNLKYGTKSDNGKDRVINGLHYQPDVSGSLNGNSKLDEGKVIELRRLASLGVTTSILMAKYGIGRTAVRDAITRKKWRHV